MNNNLIKLLQIPCCLIWASLNLPAKSYSQAGYSRPEITGKWKNFKRQALDDPGKKMLELKTEIPGIEYDLRYATQNNFMNRRMYPAGTNTTYLRAPAVTALSRIQAELNAMGLGLKIFDAYRPYSVTEKFWELVKDERYVANPAKGSGHNRGIAVDLTIIDQITGAELDMGTGFDNFTDTAHHTFTFLKEEVLHNRLLLKNLMEKHGFVALESEWWHYYLKEGNRFELLDLSFKKLKKKL